MQRVKVGDKAPDFTLSSNMGKNVTLSSFFGKKNVILYFYPRDESQGCTKEACSFRDSYEVFKDLGAEVLGVGSQSVESHAEFANRFMFPFPLLSDKDGKVRGLYGMPSTFGLIAGRATYVIDKQGIVRYIFSSQFNPEKHVQEALAILKSLRSSERGRQDS